TDVFGESSRSYAEDFIARLELGHVPADHFHSSGEVRSRAGVFRFTKSKDEPADSASQHATIEKSEGNGANADENLVVVRNRLFDVLKFQNVIRRAVFAVTNCFHWIGQCGFAIAVVRRSPVGDEHTANEHDQD